MPNPVVAIVAAAVAQAATSQDAARKASHQQADAAKAGISEEQRQFDTMRELLAPYVNAGTPALQEQQNLLGLNGEDSQKKAIDSIANSPQLQAMQLQGENAILQNASATGGLRGGNIQGALSQFRPQLLNQMINQQYDRLGGLASIGQNAAAGVGNAGMSTGQNVAALLQQQGAAQAGGTLGQAAAWGKLFNLPSQLYGMKSGGGFGMDQVEDLEWDQAGDSNMGPIDYSLNIPDPASEFMQAAQVSSGIANQKAQTGLVQQQQKLIQSEQVANAWKTMNAQQSQDALRFGGQALAAIRSGNPKIAQDLIAQRAEAARNAGDEKTAQAYDTWSKIIELNPSHAADTVESMIAVHPEGKALIDNINNMQEANRKQAIFAPQLQAEQAVAQQKTAEAANTPQRLALENYMKAGELRNLDSQIDTRAGQLNLDRDKLQTDTQMKLYELNQKSNPSINLDGDAKKMINESVTNSVAAAQSADQMRNLAGELDKQGGGYGKFGTFNEWWKSSLGNQDAVTQLKNEYSKLRTNAVIKQVAALRPASDKDIALVFKPFPDENADAKYIASFLRGMAEVNDLAVETENAKAEWLNSVGHLGKAKTDIEVEGIKVPAGTSFTDFAKKYVSSKADKTGIETEQSQLSTKSYWEHAGGQ